MAKTFEEYAAALNAKNWIICNAYQILDGTHWCVNIRHKSMKHPYSRYGHGKTVVEALEALLKAEFGGLKIPDAGEGEGEPPLAEQLRETRAMEMMGLRSREDAEKIAKVKLAINPPPKKKKVPASHEEHDDVDWTEGL